MSFVLEQNEYENNFRSARTLIVNAKETISDEYRGYTYTQVPVPEYWKLDLPFNQISYDYCTTGKYLYLNKIKNEPVKPSYFSLFGKATDTALLGLIKSSIDYVKTTKIKDLDINSFLISRKKQLLDEIEKELIKNEEFISIKQFKEILSISEKILNHESSNLISRIGYHVSRIQSITSDTLLERALPLIIEPQISASDMGFSNLMTPDFLYSEEKAIGDFKSFKQDKHDLSYRIAMAGYALAYEQIVCHI